MLRYKNILLSFLIMILFASGCTPTTRSQMPPAQRLGLTQTAPPLGHKDIVLLDIKTPVKRGDNCSVTIQGRAGITFTIAATYRIGDKTLTTFESRMAGSDGKVTWVWTVSSDTVPGTYSITITGGATDFQTAYTVTE